MESVQQQNLKNFNSSLCKTVHVLAHNKHLIKTEKKKAIESLISHILVNSPIEDWNGKECIECS